MRVALNPDRPKHLANNEFCWQAANHEHPSAGVLRSIAQAGGAALWANSAKSYEEAVQLCLAHLDDASRATGDAFAGALGDLVAASKSPAALQAVRVTTPLSAAPVARLMIALYGMHAVDMVACRSGLSTSCVRDRALGDLDAAIKACQAVCMTSAMVIRSAAALIGMYSMAGF